MPAPKDSTCCHACAHLLCHAGAHIHALAPSLLLVLLQQQGWEGLPDLHAEAQACSQQLAAACSLHGSAALADAHAQQLLAGYAQVMASSRFCV